MGPPSTGASVLDVVGRSARLDILLYLFAMPVAFSGAACGRPSLSPDDPSNLGADAGSDGPSDSPDADRSSVCGPQGLVTFDMQVPPGGGGYSYLESFGNPGDGAWWYSVASADGTQLPIFLTLPTCGSCEEADIPIGFGCIPVPAGIVSATWDGTVVTGNSRCADPVGPNAGLPINPCNTIKCVAPGQYVATMCASRVPQDCSFRQGATCVSVPFEYPAASDVVGNLPP